MPHPNIIFDLGGVLIDFSEQRLIDHFFGALPEAEQQQLAAALFHSGLWKRMDRGDFDEAGMVRETCALLPESLHRHVRNMVPRYFEAMPPLPTCALIPELKARGHGVYMLTNSPHIFHREKHRVPYIEQFDGVFASCDVRLIKPDPEIFRVFLETYNLQAKDCLFVDDMPVNCEAARQLGMHAHCFADRDLQKLTRALDLCICYNDMSHQG